MQLIYCIFSLHLSILPLQVLLDYRGPKGTVVSLVQEDLWDCLGAKGTEALLVVVASLERRAFLDPREHWVNQAPAASEGE